MAHSDQARSSKRAGCWRECLCDAKSSPSAASSSPSPAPRPPILASPSSPLPAAPAPPPSPSSPLLLLSTPARPLMRLERGFRNRLAPVEQADECGHDRARRERFVDRVCNLHRTRPFVSLLF